MGTKLIIAAFVVLAAVTAAVYVGLSSFEREKMIAAKEQTAKSSGGLFLRTVAAAVVFDDPTAIKESIGLLLRDPEVLGVELWKAEPASKAGKQIAVELRGESPVSAGPDAAASNLIVRFPARLVLRGPIFDTDHQTIAYAAIQFSLDKENSAFEALRHEILFASGSLVLLIALLLALATRIWITSPLGTLLGGVKQLEAGEKVDLGSISANDEVGTLALAFGRMAETVEQREADVRKRNADMKRIMDNVAQGFLAVTRDGVLLPEHSAIVETWMGPWPKSGESFVGYLARKAPKAASSIGGLWDNVSSGILPLDVAMGQLPTRFRIGANTYSIVYRPIEEGKSINILLVLSDITPEIEQERTKQAQEELVSIFQRVASDRSGLVQFFQEADRIVRFLLETDSPDFALLKREVHTLKGNSGFFGQQSVVAICQTIENGFDEGSKTVSAEDRDALRAAWARVSEHRRSLLGDGAKKHLEVEMSEHSALLDTVSRGAPHGEIETELRNWSLEPAQKRLVRFGDQAKELAKRLNKGDIRVLVESNNLRLHETILPEFWAAFTHLIRNAIDHGIESPAERAEARKSAVGTLQLRTLLRGDEFVVEIEDDGRGINWKKLAEKAKAAGLRTETRADLVDALFASGVSTRDEANEISGRGVGMSAVRVACESSGGKVRIQSEPGEGTRFQFVWPRTVLQGRVAPTSSAGTAN